MTCPALLGNDDGTRHPAVSIDLNVLLIDGPADGIRLDVGPQKLKLRFCYQSARMWKVVYDTRFRPIGGRLRCGWRSGNENWQRDINGTTKCAKNKRCWAMLDGYSRRFV